MNKIKVGIIGAGHMGTYHINVLRLIESVEIVGFFDINKSNIEKVLKQFDIKNYEDMEELIDKSDAIVLASSTSTHYEISRVIFSKKKHLLVEKPIAPNYKDAKEMVELAHKNNVILHIGHVERFNGAVIELEKLIKSPYLWEARRIGNGGRITDVGVIWDLMIHDVDICLRTLNSSVKHVSAHVYKKQSSNHEDIADATLTFENGCVANFITSRASQKKDRTLTISQESNYIDLDFTTQEITIYRDVEVNVDVSKKNNIKYSQQNSYERLSIMKQNPLELENRNFINAILKNKSSYEINLLDLKTIEIIEKIINSVEN